jgi:hypothetical protein
MDMNETVSIAEFSRRKKFYLDTALKGPVFLRRGNATVYRLEHVKGRFELEGTITHPVQDSKTVPAASTDAVTYKPEPQVVLENLDNGNGGDYWTTA